MTDPIAYRIARRLLSQGIEIHVVARKLDLPVSEIRMLDRLMLDEAEASERRPAVYRRVEPIPERKIVRSQNATAQGSRQQRSSLELDVELTERYEDRLEQATKQINRLGSNIERRSALL
jgi:hypothetical protein